MRTQKFGIEIEMTGITRIKAARIIAEYFHTTPDYNETVTDNQNRKWKLVYDRSIHTTGGSDTSVELVSPICTYEDIEKIQEIVRQLRHAGAKANSSCGVHVHIGAENHTAATLRNLCNIMVAKEDIICKSLKIAQSRESYCKKADGNFIGRINKKHTNTKDQFMNQWYTGYTEDRAKHYHQSRYRMLNIHSMTDKETVEFRMFNGTTHAGEIKSYIQLCLAINHQALTQKYATPNKTKTGNEKYTFRTWLLRLGMIGQEFKTAREYLLKNLEGDIAFRNGRAAA